MFQVSFTKHGQLSVSIGEDRTRVAGPGELASDSKVEYPEWSDDRLLGAIYDLFAGRIDEAYGKDLEWWDAVILEMSAKARTRVVLAPLSPWPFDRKCSEDAIKALREDLASHARKLIAAMDADQIEALQ